MQNKSYIFVMRLNDSVIFNLIEELGEHTAAIERWE